MKFNPFATSVSINVDSGKVDAYTGFPPTWKVRESRGIWVVKEKLGNFGWSQGKEEKKKKHEINKRTQNKKEREIRYIIKYNRKKFLN